MKQLIGRFILLCSAFFMAVNFAWGSISISPALVSVDLNQGRPSGKFVITNKSGQEKRYRIQVVHFRFSPTGGLGIINPDERSLATWIKFNPREFSLPGNSKRIIRYAIVPRGKLSKKTYWAAMELESLDANEIKSKVDENSSYSIKAIPSILVPIFGTVGDVEYSGVVDDVGLNPTEEGLEVTVKVVNVGEGRLALRGIYQVLSTSGELVAQDTLASGLVLPENSRLMMTRIPTENIAAGNYKLRIAYELVGTDKQMIKEVPLVLN